MQGYVVQVSTNKPNKGFEMQDIFAVRKLARGEFPIVLQDNFRKRAVISNFETSYFE